MVLFIFASSLYQLPDLTNPDSAEAVAVPEIIVAVADRPSD